MKVLKLKTHHFNKTLPCHKPMLTQVKRRVENGPQKKEGVLTVATLFYWKFCFSLRTYKELILCTNYLQMPIFMLFVSAGVLFQGFFFRSNHPEVFLVKGVLKICSKFTGEHPCRSAISIKLLCNCTLVWLFFRKFPPYFRNTFS